LFYQHIHSDLGHFGPTSHRNSCQIWCRIWRRAPKRITQEQPSKEATPNKTIPTSKETTSSPTISAKTDHRDDIFKELTLEENISEAKLEYWQFKGRCPRIKKFWIFELNLYDPEEGSFAMPQGEIHKGRHL
jgi:hypothetical protein